VNALAGIVLRLLADLAGLVVPSAPPRTRHRIGQHLGVRAGTLLGGPHHGYLLAPASA